MGMGRGGCAAAVPAASTNQPMANMRRDTHSTSTISGWTDLLVRGVKKCAGSFGRRSAGRWYIDDPGRDVLLEHHAAEQAANGGEDRAEKAPDHQRYGLREDEERESRRTTAADALEDVAEIRRHRSGHLDG